MVKSSFFFSDNESVVARWGTSEVNILEVEMQAEQRDQE